MEGTITNSKVMVAAAAIILTTTFIKYMSGKNKEQDNNNNNSDVNNNNSNNNGETQFPSDWNELLKACFLESCQDVADILNDPNTKPETVNYVDATKWNALHVAASKGNLIIMQTLLIYNNQHNGSILNVNAQNDKGYTPLHITSCNGYTQLTELLLENGADISVVSYAQETPLFLACSNQYEDIVRILLLQIGNTEDRTKYINQFNIQGSTPFHISIQKKSLPIAKLLLSNGADINALRKDRCTPLHVACELDYQEGIAFLLQNNADPSKVNMYGKTPLQEACTKGNYIAIKTILDKYPHLVDAKDKNGNTPLHMAINAIKYLGSLECDVKKHQQVIKQLFKFNALPNIYDQDHSSPLHLLAGIGERANSFLEILLENGAVPTLENAMGLTSLHIAYNQQNMQMYNDLREWCKKFYPAFIHSFDPTKKRPQTKINIK